MHKLLTLIAVVLLALPAQAEDTILLNDDQSGGEQPVSNNRWSIEAEAGLAQIKTASNFQSASYDFTNGCTVNSGSGFFTCNEDARNNLSGLSLFWAFDERYSFGLRYQNMDRLYYLETSSAEFVEQDVNLFTLVARRYFDFTERTRSFAELGLGRYKSDSRYYTSYLELNNSHSGWTPVIGAGLEVKMTDRWSVVPSLRYIKSMGEESGITGTTGGNHVKTLDESVTQLSIGMRFAF